MRRGDAEDAAERPGGRDGERPQGRPARGSASLGRVSRTHALGSAAGMARPRHSRASGRGRHDPATLAVMASRLRAAPGATRGHPRDPPVGESREHRPDRVGGPPAAASAARRCRPGRPTPRTGRAGSGVDRPHGAGGGARPGRPAARRPACTASALGSDQGDGEHRRQPYGARPRARGRATTASSVPWYGKSPCGDPRVLGSCCPAGRGGAAAVKETALMAGPRIAGGRGRAAAGEFARAHAWPCPAWPSG